MSTDQVRINIAFLHRISCNNKNLPEEIVEHAGWVFVHRFLIPSVLVDVRHFGCEPELSGPHSQQSNEYANDKEISSLDRVYSILNQFQTV